VLVVHPSLPPRTVKEFVALLKARPDEINYASSGNGSTPHLATELFKLMTGTRMTHVPYKGGGPATIDVVAGHVPVYIMSPVQAAPHMKAARLRALGVSVPRGPRSTTRANPAELTTRELDVLRLVSAGKRNAEIAEELVVSRRTVDHHVSAILRKLEAGSRGEAVATARRLGLLPDA